MAKKKKEFEIVALKNSLGCHIYIDNPEIIASEIEAIEGVVKDIIILKLRSVISVDFDPRYDSHEIIEEIRDLLKSQVPQVFREEL